MIVGSVSMPFQLWKYSLVMTSHEQSLWLPGLNQFYGLCHFKALKMVTKSATWDLRLSNLLCSTRNRHATDHRDKVFGLLGLATHTGGITADYSKSTVKVFVEVARALIEEDANLNILSYANGLAACPSWVPDWGIANDREHFINDNFESARYCAALRTNPNNLCISSRLSILDAAGTKV